MRSSWLLKSLMTGIAVGLVTFAGFYFFFSIHRELDIQPLYAWRLALLSFLLSFIVSAIYFRMRSGP